MSKSEKLTDESKIGNNAVVESSRSLSSSNNRLEKKLENSGSSKYTTKPSPQHMQSTQSDGNIINVAENVGLKQKLVNKVKSWNNKESKILQNNESNTSTKTMVELATKLEGLTLLSPDESDDNLFKSDWLRARDSLENLFSPKSDKTEIMNSKSTPFPPQEKTMLNESPCSESHLGNTKALNSVTKVLAWDPWDKLGRKNKKDSKRRKHEKYPSGNSQAHSSKDHTAGDELRCTQNPVSMGSADDEFSQVYEYQPYQSKSIKAVEFTNEVMVVYITGDEVIGESTEPLKKELEQQIRNKEMRQGHSPATILGKVEEDYMSAWFKK